MHKFILFIKEFRIYKKKELLEAVTSFSNKQFFIFISLFLVSIISVLTLLAHINGLFLVEVPVSGGSLNEGIVGVPTLVNPVIALSDADKDLTSLVFSGLMRKTPEGKFIPDLAENYTISTDGTTYTFILKKEAKFHDGKKVTADDIIFTIEKIKDPTIKSPRKSGWDGINVSKTDDQTVVFTLAQPYISFIDNTTIGILPANLWKNITSSEFNLSPLNIKAVGSGPYKVKNVLKDNDGIPEKYELERFNDFSLGKPSIKYLNIISYANEKEVVKALNSNLINQAGGISPDSIKDLDLDNLAIHTATLPRIFGIFFNSNKNPILADQTIIKALNYATDRQDIINQVLASYGSIVYSPIPEKIIPDIYKEDYSNGLIEKANTLLDKAGWKIGDDGIRIKGGSSSKTVTKKVKGKTISQTIKTTSPTTRLAFSLTTGDMPELKAATILIQAQLKKIGVEVNIEKVYETGQLNQLIRGREYEALLFGQLINYESDLYSYWHSSQRTDPGRNIAMYNNKKIDALLEVIQKIQKVDDRQNKYEDLAKEFNQELPALLIYSPKYIYITSQNLTNISLINITVPADRFASAYTWAVDTDKVWKIFTK